MNEKKKKKNIPVKFDYLQFNKDGPSHRVITKHSCTVSFNVHFLGL